MAAPSISANSAVLPQPILIPARASTPLIGAPLSVIGTKKITSPCRECTRRFLENKEKCGILQQFSPLQVKCQEDEKCFCPVNSLAHRARAIVCPRGR